MRKEDFRIVFMGTPEFAVASLEALLKAGYNIVAVVTAPDKPAGRGKMLTEPEVKVFAKKHNLNILQPEKLKDPHFVETLKELNPNLGIVVAFRMLPEIIWALPKLGTFNLHASLLPQYRGAAPINHAIINGETETGVTTFFLSHEIDTGNIILQQKIDIGIDTTAGQLHDRLMTEGAKVVLATMQAIEKGNVTPISQESLIAQGNEVKAAPKIFKEDCRINWNKSTHEIYNFIRGLSPYPASFTILKPGDGKEEHVKIYKSGVEKLKHENEPGDIYTDNSKKLGVWVKDGIIWVLELQIAGKKRMLVKDFLNGFKIPDGSKML